MSKAPMGYDYIRKEGQAGRMGQKLMAIVAEGSRGRFYLAPLAEHEDLPLPLSPTGSRNSNSQITRVISKPRTMA